MDKPNYSAADLVKKSAAQIVYFKNRSKDISERMKAGVQFQSKITEVEKVFNKGCYAEELRGAYEFNSGVIFFCVDLISENKFYEVKSVLDEDNKNTLEYPQWYLESSILQSAVYKSLLLQKKDRMLYTPKFRLKEGYEFIAKEIDPNWDYILTFGEVGKYLVNVNNPQAIIDYFVDKTTYLTDYDRARYWDKKHKYKDYANLNKYFSCNKID